MSTRFTRASALAACLTLAAFADAPAQTQWSAGSGAFLETYSFATPDATGVRSVSLMTLPFAASLQPGAWLGITVSGAFASATLNRADNTESTVSGLTDTAIQLSVPVVANRVIVAATVLAPTGRTTYSQEEAQVAGVIAADLLPFRVSNWGSGGGVDLSTSVAATTGAVNLGARVGYQMSREFDLLENEEFVYQPGNQLYVRLGADGNAGASRIAAQVTVYRFGSDAVNQQNLYQAGNRIQAMGTLSSPLGRRGRSQLYAGLQRRERGVFLDRNDDTPAQTLLLFGGGVRQPVASGVLLPSADVRLLRSADGVGQGYVATVGSGYSLPLGTSATVVPSARVRLGNLLVRDGIDTALSGFEVGATIRFGSNRP